MTGRTREANEPSLRDRRDFYGKILTILLRSMEE